VSAGTGDSGPTEHTIDATMLSNSSSKSAALVATK
jgi:hypothetical protein